MNKHFDKICFMIVFYLLSAGAGYTQKIRWGFKAGLNENTVVFDLTSLTDGALIENTKVGFQAGAIADYAINADMSLRANLLYVSRGGERKTNALKLEIDLSAIDLPIYFLYHHQGFFIGAGPYISYGLKATYKNTGEKDVDLYRDTSSGITGIYLKRVEAGLAAIMGYEFPGGFVMNAGYSRGLSNINRYGGNDIKAWNRFYHLSIGYFIPRKKK